MLYIRKYGSTFCIGIAVVILVYFGPMGKLYVVIIILLYTACSNMCTLLLRNDNSGTWTVIVQGHCVLSHHNIIVSCNTCHSMIVAGNIIVLLQ